MLHIGCHLSSSAGFAAMGHTALSIGADTFQFFTRNPRGSKAKAIDPTDAQALMNLMADRLGVRRPWIKCSRSLLYAAATIENIFAFLTFRTPQLSRSMVRSVTSRSAYSSKKLKNTTGFEYRSLEDTLEYLIKDFRSQTT